MSLVVRASELTDTRLRWVYYIQSASPVGEVKIGVAANPQARRRELQVGNPYRLQIRTVQPGDEGLERSLHEKFSEHRLCGEWFFPGPDLLSHIQALIDEPATPPVRKRPESLITVRGAAEALGETDYVLRRWLRQGRLTTWRLPSGTIRLDLSEVEALAEERTP